MSTIRPIDMKLLEDLFDSGQGAGYVLDFSDRTFRDFFADELNIDIDDQVYAKDGRSKGKRLRCFLRTVDSATAVRTLKSLWEYREALRIDRKKEEWVSNGHGRFLSLIDRLEGRDGPPPQRGPVPVPAFDRDRFLKFKGQIMELNALAPQARGYAFEQFLKELFNSFGLEAREPFRLRGEQIDGSFILAGETYLVEAKWQAQPSGVAELHGFHGKVEQKAAWARGLFISYSGFTPDGLYAFGRGKRVVCVNGFDLYEALNREIPLPHLLERKVRGAAESGSPFIDIRELFP